MGTYIENVSREFLVIIMQLYHLLLSLLAVPALASETPATDKECFTSNYNSSAKTDADTFQIRVKHGLGIGQLYTLEKNKVLKVPATSQSVNTVCVLLQICDGDLQGNIAKQNRTLYAVYNGTNVCAGIDEMNINITSTDKIPQPVPTQCNYHCMNADLDAPDVEFTFYQWIVNADNKTANYTDTLTVKAGSGSNMAAAILVIFASLFASKF